MSAFVTDEINSQPATWREAVRIAPELLPVLPQAGERVAVIGCGTSWFMAMSYGVVREERGLGETDAFSGSEVPFGRAYDRALLISRSGTTTEILRALEEYRKRGIPTTVITAINDSPASELADHTVVLAFADEQSVVQTRFATTTLTLLRASLGEQLDDAIADAERALTVPITDREALTQVTFVGRGWTIGLAHEAALKTREAAQYWSEAYPAMDYRHGPFAIAEAGRGVWAFGDLPDGLAAEVTGTGARMIDDRLDPVAELIVAQRFAVALAEARGLNPDSPRNLTRAVHLGGTPAS